MQNWRSCQVFLCNIHSSLKRGSAFGPTRPNVLMISMCKECWSWYWGSSRNEASCILTRSSSYKQAHVELSLHHLHIQWLRWRVLPYLFLCDGLHDGAKGRDGGDSHWSKNSSKVNKTLWPFTTTSLFQVLVKSITSLNRIRMTVQKFICKKLPQIFWNAWLTGRLCLNT